MAERKAYPIPAIPNPGAFRQLCFFIPDDDGHSRAFWGSVYYLASWLAWERDEAHSGVDCAQAWKDAIALSQNELNCIVPVPFPGSETGADDASANVVIWLISIVQKIADDIAALIPRQTTLDTLLGWFHAFQWNSDPTIALGELYDYVASLTPGELAQWLDQCAYIPYREKLKSVIDQNGSFLDDWASRLADWLNNTAETMVKMLNATAEGLAVLTGLRALVDSGGGGGGAGFGADCIWEHTSDFTTSSDSWASVDATYLNSSVVPPNPAYFPAAGRNTLGFIGEKNIGNGFYNVSLVRTFIARKIQQVDVTCYSVSSGYWKVRIQLSLAGVAQAVAMWDIIAGSVVYSSGFADVMADKILLTIERHEVIVPTRISACYVKGLGSNPLE